MQVLYDSGRFCTMLHSEMYDSGPFYTPARRTFGARFKIQVMRMEIENKMTYEAPAITVVDVRMESTILASSGNAKMNFFYDEEDF